MFQHIVTHQETHIRLSQQRHARWIRFWKCIKFLNQRSIDGVSKIFSCGGVPDPERGARLILVFFCFSFSKISSHLFKKGSSAGVPASWNVEIGVFPKWNRNSLNSANLINHWNMIWAQFKNHVSHMCLTGTVARPAGSSPFTVMINILPLNSANSVKTFWKNSIVLILIGTTS